MASFAKEVNWRFAKRPLKTNGRLANRGLTSLVKEATGIFVKRFGRFPIKPSRIANLVIKLRVPVMIGKIASGLQGAILKSLRTSDAYECQ